MSNIYIQEPPTSGKVLLKTSVGEIEIELWAKEAPKTCRNFIQMCYDKVYDGSPFYRLVRSFIVQCGEFNKRVDCIEPFKNEFHSRIRFSRRGLVALALTQDDAGDNTMEFFITLDAAPELNNKHTIFGKVTGETIYNVLKLNDSPTDANDRPINPHKINKVKILHSPFADISPRIISSKDESKSSSKSKREKGVKNFKLISFGDEAEQDEECLKDFEPSTSATAVPKPSKNKNESSDAPSQHESSDAPSRPESKDKKAKPKSKKDESSDSDDYLTTVEQEKRSELEKKRKQIQNEIADLKKDYQSGKKGKVVKEVLPEPQHQDEAVKTYLMEKEKYKTDKLKGKSREEFTLSLLNKFKTKLTSASEKETTQDDNSDDENWLSHKLDFSDSRDAVLAKDASKKEDDWYDIYDPRNPLNKRKRGAEKAATSSEAPTKKSK